MIPKRGNPLPQEVWVTSHVRVGSGAAPMRVTPTNWANCDSVFYGRANGAGREFLYTISESFLTKQEANEEALRLATRMENGARIDYQRKLKRLEKIRAAIDKNKD